MSKQVEYLIISLGDALTPERFWPWAVVTREEYEKEFRAQGWVVSNRRAHLDPEQIALLEKGGMIMITLNDLITTASEAYPDEYIKDCWDFEAAKAKENYVCGDTLALFIVRELESTYSDYHTDEQKVLEAVRVITNALNDLQGVLSALQTLKEKVKK